VEALRAVLSPVKREGSGSFLRDASRPDDDQQLQHSATTNTSQTSIAQNATTAQTKTHHAQTAALMSVAADKLSATATGMTSASDKHAQQCVYCAQSFKTKGELERHVKSTHVMPTTSQKCNICDEVFPSAAVLAEHKLTHCKVQALSTESRPTVLIPWVATEHRLHSVVCLRIKMIKNSEIEQCSRKRTCMQQSKKKRKGTFYFEKNAKNVKKRKR